MYEREFRQKLLVVNKYIERPPTNYHSFSFFRINQVRKRKFFRFFYNHVGKTTYVDFANGSFTRNLNLKPLKTYAIQTYWKPNCRKRHIKCRWGKVILWFVFDEDRFGRRIEFYLPRKPGTQAR
jgi:hypothetical protein